MMFKENKVYKFYEQVKQEASRIVWPTGKELVSSTAIVMVVVLIVSLVCLILDYSIHNFIQFLLNIGK